VHEFQRRERKGRKGREGWKVRGKEKEEREGVAGREE